MMEQLKKIIRVQLFALLLGLIDGILTVLALATGHVLRAQGSITLGLALKVAFATSLSGACIYFFSEYSRQRHRLVHAETELNLASHGRLATTHLGRQILKETAIGMLVSSICNFLGAMLPLISAILFPEKQWIAILIALVMLIALGVGISRLVYGKAILWCASLFVAGILVSLVGYKLNVV